MAIHRKTDRAKLFASFDPLKGHKEAIKEQERIKVSKIELTDEKKDELDQIFSLIQPYDIISVTYYNNYEYIKIAGTISRISKISRTIYISNTPIAFEDIYEIDLT